MANRDRLFEGGKVSLNESLVRDLRDVVFEDGSAMIDEIMWQKKEWAKEKEKGRFK
jgi:hypothetical protein